MALATYKSPNGQWRIGPFFWDGRFMRICEGSLIEMDWFEFTLNDDSAWEPLDILQDRRVLLNGAFKYNWFSLNGAPILSRNPADLFLSKYGISAYFFGKACEGYQLVSGRIITQSFVSTDAVAEECNAASFNRAWLPGGAVTIAGGGGWKGINPEPDYREEPPPPPDKKPERFIIIED